MKPLIKDFVFSLKAEHTFYEISINPPAEYDKEFETVDVKIFDVEFKPCGSMFGYDGTLLEGKLVSIKIIKNRPDIVGDFFLEASIVHNKPAVPVEKEDLKLLNNFGFLNKDFLLRKHNLKQDSKPDEQNPLKNDFKAFLNKFKGPKFRK